MSNPSSFDATRLIKGILPILPEPKLEGVVLGLQDWLKRNLPEPDYILGHWLTTTSRLLFAAPTGLGKSMFWVAAGMASSASMPFLRWEASRPRNVLYVDGEMSRRLMKQRLADEADRIGVVPSGFHVLNHEDVENFAPLNSPEGRNTIEAMIAKIGRVDLTIFDNIMSLNSGDMKDEESWRQTIPWQHSLTKRNIGQVWLHHTGHDETRSYGTKTREWQMDTVMFGEKVERPDADVSFKIEFRKARERTPEHRAEFADIKVALVDNAWMYSGGSVSPVKPSPTGAKFLAALTNAPTVRHNGRLSVTAECWRRECVKLGLIDRDTKPDQARSLFSKYRLELVTRNLIACDGDHAWRIT